MNPRHLKYSEKEREMELLFTLGALSVYCPCMERVEEGEVRVVVEGEVRGEERVVVMERGEEGGGEGGGGWRGEERVGRGSWSLTQASLHSPPRD